MGIFVRSPQLCASFGEFLIRLSEREKEMFLCLQLSPARLPGDSVVHTPQVLQVYLAKCIRVFFIPAIVLCSCFVPGNKS